MHCFIIVALLYVILTYASEYPHTNIKCVYITVPVGLIVRCAVLMSTIVPYLHLV